MQGKTVSGYTLQQMLGKGGMAEVWLAENAIGNKAAVKLLLPKFCDDETVVARFQNEAKVMVQLRHANIRQVLDIGQIDDRPCIVMEYLEGDDLKSMIKSGQRFTEEELHRWWNQLVSALNYTHAQGIVHRDIKPSNIFIDKAGNVKLLDFGIAKIKEGISMTQTGTMMGTLMYMSPEQVDDSKHIGPASDIYSLAVTFVHLLTGKAPYDSSTSSDYAIRKGIVEIPLNLDGVPSEWQAFLRPYLAKNPAERPALRELGSKRAASFTTPISDETMVGNSTPAKDADDEGTVVTETPSTPQPQPQPQPQSQPRNRRVWPWILAACAVAAVVVCVVLMGGEKELVTNEEQGGEVSSYVEFENMDRSFTVSSVSFTMKPVEGGTFQMGGNDSEAESDEKPVHDVTLSSFYMGETEVTQALWQAVMGNNPSYFKSKGDNLPVEMVSWNDCQDFIRKLNEQVSGQLPADWHFALPTEAQWEYAARGGQKSSGGMYAGSSNIDFVGWYGGNSGNCTHPVKQKAPNDLGLYDMSGNVWEWCADWYSSSFYSDNRNWTDPVNTYVGSYRVLRGGSWYNYASRCRVALRINYGPGFRGSNYGFRLALVHQ